ncbi:MAG TPA: hypothetical protein VES92_12220 [Nitrospiraceae bacterium]|nr:hypothetical protein [Nitrospiraceae bacterium]
MTTVAGGCNKLATLEFWSKFNADRDRLGEGAEPLPAEAAGRTPAAPANGVEAGGATAAEPVEMTAGSGAPDDFVMGAVGVRFVLLAESAVVCVTCPAGTLDGTAAGSAWDEAVGAVVEAMAGRLGNVR